MRYPVVAGQFYPSNADSLRTMISEFATPASNPSLVACVSPHAGYMFSGKTAGMVHSLLPDAETYVIVGPNHSGYGSAVAISMDTWVTPLGEAEIDKEFVKAMSERVMDVDETAHRYEHSLEVQVPFLQYLHHDFNIVPICLGMQDEETVEEVTEEIIQAEKKTGRRIALVASSDMHHFLPERDCRERDNKVIEAILSMDMSRYFTTIYELQASVCGYGAIGVAMEYAKRVSGEAELIDYSTSGEVASKESVVGYAGIAFKG